MVNSIKSMLLAVLAVAMMLFIFGPVLGLRETRTQYRSRMIHEEHERRQEETRQYSEREAKRSREFLERAEKEIFGDR